MRAVLLCAGHGTRLAPLTDTTPKVMLPLDGKPLLGHTLEWLRHHGIRDVAINLHHLPTHITDYVGDGSQWGMRVWYSHEPELLGTAGALHPMRGWLWEPFVVVYGDKFMQADLTDLVAFHNSRVALLTVAVHETDRPQGAGLVQFMGNGHIVKYVEKPDEPFSKWGNAGLYVCAVDQKWHIPAPPCDWGRDVLPRASAAYAHPMAGLAMDIGTPERYAKAQRVAASPGAVFIDRDGTINKAIPHQHVTTPEQFTFLPGALRGLANLAQNSGRKIVIWTNQPAVGKGDATREQVAALHEWMVKQIEAAGGRVDGVYVCPHAHGEGCACRKPAPGLLLRAARELGVNLAKSVVVGDTRFDLQAAWAAGVRECYAVKTGWPVDELPPRHGGHQYRLVEDLCRAARHITGVP